MENIKLEKFIEAIYDHMRGRISPELRKDCEALRFISEILVEIKCHNNERIMSDLGVMKIDRKGVSGFRT